MDWSAWTVMCFAEDMIAFMSSLSPFVGCHQLFTFFIFLLSLSLRMIPRPTLTVITKSSTKGTEPCVVGVHGEVFLVFLLLLRLLLLLILLRLGSGGITLVLDILFYFMVRDRDR